MSYAIERDHLSAPFEFIGEPAPRINARGPIGFGCDCGGSCGMSDQGLGQACTGLFCSLNPSTWGVGEWAIVVGGGFLLLNMGQGGAVHKKASKYAQQGGFGIGALLLAGAGIYAVYALSQNQASGLSDYQHQGFVLPQILAAPTINSQISIPDGW